MVNNKGFLTPNQTTELKPKKVVKRKLTTLYVRNLQGIEFPIKVTTKKSNSLDGNQALEGTIEWDNKINCRFLNDIDRFWEISDHENVWNRILYIDKVGKGERLEVSFKAVPTFFDYMNTNKIMQDDIFPYKYNGSMTAYNAMKRIFDDTPFNFVLVDSFTAHEWTNFGNDESRLEVFKKALNNYGMEFEIEGSTVYLKNQIGRDTSIMYRHKFNADNIHLEIDAQNEFTAIRGFGDFGDNQGEGEEGEIEEEDYLDARLIPPPYISPLAKIVGVRWAESIKDGRYKIMANLERKMKDTVDNSLKVSVKANIQKLTQQGYPIDDSAVGDRIFLVDNRIGYNEEVRVVDEVITKDWQGKILDAELTFGDQDLGRKYQSNINTAMTNINDLFTGKKQLPKTFLDQRLVEISAIINGNRNSSFEYMPTGVIGYNVDNQNYMMKLVADGLGFSNNGGNSYIQAISAKHGINASAVMAGELRGINIYQESNIGSVALENGEIESYIGKKKAMKWGGWKQEFYNPDETLIGSLEPTRLLNSEHYGLSLTVTNDFLTIGHWIGGQRRPVFRTQELEGRKSTYVLGPYDNRGQDNHTELVLGANSNIGLAEDGMYNRNSQASITLRNKPQEEKGNSVSLYFGGISQFQNQEFSVRANIDENTSKQVAVFREDEIRLDTDKVYFGGTSARVENFDDGIFLYASGDNQSGLKMWKGGQVDVISQGVPIHQFYSTGNKSGGSIEVDGNRLGMSPIDSPQTLIEYIDFKVEVKEIKVLNINKEYLKTVNDFAVYLNNDNIKLKEKNKDNIILSGNGVVDVRFVGLRKGFENTFWNKMN